MSRRKKYRLYYAICRNCVHLIIKKHKKFNEYSAQHEIRCKFRTFEMYVHNSTYDLNVLMPIGKSIGRNKCHYEPCPYTYKHEAARKFEEASL